MVACLSHNRVVCITLSLLVVSGCLKATQFNHSPAMAARAAQRFAHIAFVERNFTTAYGLLSTKTKSDVTFEQFRDEILRMHAAKNPASVKAVQFERIPGQKEMSIYLVGEAAGEKFYYRFVMEGTQETDYRVAGVWRNEGPYPPAESVKALASPGGP